MRGYKRLGLPLFLMGSVLGTASTAHAQAASQSAAIQVPNLSSQDMGVSAKDLLGIVKLQQAEINALKKRLEVLETKTDAADKSGSSGGSRVVRASAPRTVFKSQGNGPVNQAQEQPVPPIDLPSAAGPQTTPPSAPVTLLRSKGNVAVNQAQGQPVPPVELPSETAPEAPEGSQPSGAPAEQPVPGGPQPPQAIPEEERPKAEKPTEQLLVQQSAVLLRAGTIQVEPGIDYQHYYNNSVNIAGFTIFNAIVIGTIDVDKVDRTIVTGSLSGRYGITDRIQADARLPYVYRTDSTIFGVGTGSAAEVSISGHDLGDASFGLSYQPLLGGGAIPAVIVRAQGVIPTGVSPFDVGTRTVSGRKVLKSAPTGNGYYAAGLTATAVWRTDPLVLYAGAGYTYNFGFTPSGRSDFIKPGDTLTFNMGSVVALNDVVSLNLGMQSSQSFAATQNGQKALGSESTDARLLLGASIGISQRLTLLVTGTVGLTTDAPAYGLTVSLPFTF